MRRAWISFYLQPLVQPRWKGSVWAPPSALERGRAAAVAAVPGAGETPDQSFGSALFKGESKAGLVLSAQL